MKKLLIATFCILFLLGWRVYVGNAGRGKRALDIAQNSNQVSEIDHAKIKYFTTKDDFSNKGDSLLFKTIVDSKSGRFVGVDSNQAVITLRSKDGSEIWSTNLVIALGNMPVVGEKKIGLVRLLGSNIVVFVGKDIFRIDGQSGSVTYCGAN